MAKKQHQIKFGARVKRLRQELGLSQEALGTQGFISTPGWIKIENGQRQPSEKLIESLTRWLSQSKHLRAGSAAKLKEELLTLKYMGSSSRFVQSLAAAHAAGLTDGIELAPQADARAPSKTRRGRPRKSTA